eukprot:sb/3474561/
MSTPRKSNSVSLPALHRPPPPPPSRASRTLNPKNSGDTIDRPFSIRVHCISTAVLNDHHDITRYESEGPPRKSGRRESSGSYYDHHEPVRTRAEIQRKDLMFWLKKGVRAVRKGSRKLRGKDEKEKRPKSLTYYFL